jgi:hypothetical protein
MGMMNDRSLPAKDKCELGDVPHVVENGEAVAAMVTVPAHAASSSVCLFELFDTFA